MDFKTAIFKTRDSLDFFGTKTDTYTYTVTEHGSNFINMDLNGETRKTPDGQSVRWKFVILNDTTYTWHRLDWEEGRYTQTANSCR